MERRYMLTLALTNLLVLVFSLSLLLAQAQQTFTGSEAEVTTDTFECSEFCRITWTTVYEDPTRAEFDVTIRQSEGNDFVGGFWGLSGTTHLYAKGTFYFRVSGQEITAWEITVEEEPIESVEPSTYFSGGLASVNTGIFTCAEHCTITWTTKSEDPTRAFFSAEIRQLGFHFSDRFEGLSGTTHLYAEGMFYFDVHAWKSGITAWEITVEEVPLSSMEPSTYFSGVGDVTTEIFTCAEHCTITWMTEAKNTISASFLGNIHQAGNEFFQQFWGLNGTTHLYEEGSFYFKVQPFDITAWEITVEDVPLPSPSTYFAGLDIRFDDLSFNTGIFTCSEHCTITWTTETENPTRASFEVGIRQLGEESVSERFEGPSGTTHLYAEGTFYFRMYGRDITAWEIIVEDVPLPSPSTYFAGIEIGLNHVSFTTGIFTCAAHCTITWTTETEDPDSSAFSVRIYRLGEENYDDWFGGLNGTTHLYAEGTFYFKLKEIWGITAWEITVEEVPLPSPSTYFAGMDDACFNTGIFTCAGHCTLNWTTETEDLASFVFRVRIRQLEDESFSDKFEGRSGITSLYAEGTFYFEVYAYLITAWEIIVEEIPLETTPMSTPTPMPTPKKTTPRELFIPGFELLPAIAAFPLVLYLTRKKK